MGDYSVDRQRWKLSGADNTESKNPISSLQYIRRSAFTSQLWTATDKVHGSIIDCMPVLENNTQGSGRHHSRGACARKRAKLTQCEPNFTHKTISHTRQQGGVDAQYTIPDCWACLQRLASCTDFFFFFSLPTSTGEQLIDWNSREHISQLEKQPHHW